MKTSRREFFKSSAASLVALSGSFVGIPALLKIFAATPAQAQQGGFVKPGEGMAASVGYVEDKKKAAKADQIDRGGVKFAGQKCGTCALFVKNSSDANGKCPLFSGQQVKATSWCRSWSKKV